MQSWAVNADTRVISWSISFGPLSILLWTQQSQVLLPHFPFNMAILTWALTCWSNLQLLSAWNCIRPSTWLARRSARDWPSQATSSSSFLMWRLSWLVKSPSRSTREPLRLPCSTHRRSGQWRAGQRRPGQRRAGSHRRALALTN